MREFILWFEEIGKGDTPLVGGKCANLGELKNRVEVPTMPGFAVTSHAYRHFIERAGLMGFIKETLRGLDTHDTRDLAFRGKAIRKAVSGARIPGDLKEAIVHAYRKLGKGLDASNPHVAVRSSATAEDLPGASFAGQQETYLNVRGEEDLIRKIKLCFASLFTNRAISYRVDRGFDHFRVYLSVAVQKMCRSDIGSAGVMFTIDPDSGFRNVVCINGSYGLGECVVKGSVIPDSWMVFKPTMRILERKLGSKSIKLVRGIRGNMRKKVSNRDQKEFCISDKQVLELAKYAMRIEEYYKCPMDIEWAFDGETGKLYILQARPETVHSIGGNIIREYALKERGKILVRGAAIGRKISSGRVRILKSAKNIHDFRKGEVLVTDMTDPDWEPIMKVASAIVTNKGGTTSHAAIVSRELGVPCIIGTKNATKILKTGKTVTVDCSTGDGLVYEGELGFKVTERDVKKIPRTRTKVMVNIGEPNRAFSLAMLPVQGVGLAREEFIINSCVGVHPLHLLMEGESERFVAALTAGRGKIAAAFYPRPVIVRLSDFKSDEYANLEGGTGYEPVEDNPMIGWRGASRYYDESFSPAFELECKALKRVREDLGLKNVTIMVPFCRTPEEGKKVLGIMEKHGLSRRSGCRLYVMAEIPSNVVLAGEFAKIFDGFSIGSNDLTQLTLGLDRNSEKLSYLFDERNEAVKRMISMLIKTAHKCKRSVGICGEAPSNYPDFIGFLVKERIDSISVEPDAVLRTIMLVSRAEKRSR
jgi:pyruvate,water dikinase